MKLLVQIMKNVVITKKAAPKKETTFKGNFKYVFISQ